MTETPAQQLYAAIADGATESARAIIDSNPELLDEYALDETWLHVAASFGQTQIVELLVRAGIDVNAGEKDRPDTPLTRAAQSGHVETARWLLEHGADVQERGGSAPLMSAVIDGNLEMVRLLVEAGADVDAVAGGDQSRSPLAWAEFYSRDEVADYLRQQGAASIDEDGEGDRDEIVEHLEATLGEVQPLSLKRIVEGSLPIEILVVRGEDRVTLVTSGMSAEAMTVPKGEEEYQYAELVIHLPPRWPLGKKALAKDKNFWPIEWLLSIAQYPRDNDTWLGGSHTIIANAEPPEPLGAGVSFTCLLLLAQESELGQIETSDGRTIVLYTLFPLYTEERDLEIESGTIELLKRFEQYGISDVVDVGRDNVAE